MLKKLNIYGLSITCADIDSIISDIFSRVKNNTYGNVCAANVHMLMEAQDSLEFRRDVNAASIICPDGMPLVWLMRKLGCKSQSRVTGYDLCKHICERAAKDKFSIGFLGSTNDALTKAVSSLKKEFKDLKINYQYSPEVFNLEFKNECNVINEINQSGIKILFVAFGCPKQEEWMAKRKTDIHAVMVGIGAVIDFLSGVKKRAPLWMQNVGLEWLYRLVQEPRRLFRRYVVLNTRFIVLLIRQKITGNL